MPAGYIDWSVPVFLVLSGVPCSGKTTWRDRVLLEHPDLVLISSDDRVEQRAAQTGVSYQEAYLAHKDEILAELFADAAHALGNGLSVIWDQTNLTPDLRREKLAIMPKSHKAVAVAFEVDPVEQKRRVDEREKRTGKHIPEFVIAKQNADYSAPTVEEGFHMVVVHRNSSARETSTDAGSTAAAM